MSFETHKSYKDANRTTLELVICLSLAILKLESIR